jgi:hypothetical protein
MAWFGRKKQGRPKFSPELTQILERVRVAVEDEAFQNARYPEAIRMSNLANPKVDQVPNGTGPFGRSLTNPVPVNGPIGEVVYLSRLQSFDGQPILFHRIGSSLDMVDIYETVALNGRSWDVLFLSMYFPGKSRLAPSGYTLVPTGVQPLIYGTNIRLANFPDALPASIGDTTRRMFGTEFSPREVPEALKTLPFVRPQHHQKVLDEVHSLVKGFIRPPSDPSLPGFSTFAQPD